MKTVCNEDEQNESTELNTETILDEKRKTYEEWLEIVQEIRMKIDL